MPRLSCALVATLLLTLASGSAQADTAAEAKQHFDSGVSAYALGRYAEAAAEWEKAYGFKPDAALLFNAAQAHRAAGNLQRALMLYQNYLRIYGGSVGNEADVQRLVAQLKETLASQSKSQMVPPSGPLPLAMSPSSAPPSPTLGGEPAPAPIAESVTATPERDERPVYKKAWFWGVMGGVVAVVVVGVTLGAVYGTQAHDPKPSIATWSF